MTHRILIAALSALVAGCGMGTEGDQSTTGASPASLYQNQLEPLALAEPFEVERTLRCWDEVVQPQVTATLRELVQLRTREVMTDVGPVVQSSYLNTSGDDEEIRKGIAEFKVFGDVYRAQLRFKESRTVWPYPVAADTHQVSVYAADFKATVEDFDAPTFAVMRFETDVNSPPSPLVAADVTRAVTTRQPDVGFRFQLENIPGSGTQFDQLELVVRRCHNTVREL